jgi:hypothetical protein
MAKLSRIHVNKHVITGNRKHDKSEPPISIKRGKMNIYAHTVDILGASKIIYSPDKPLKCGARLWIETYAPVLADDKEVM